jgi:hypothetical protein
MEYITLQSLFNYFSFECLLPLLLSTLIAAAAGDIVFRVQKHPCCYHISQTVFS